jgi:plasmid replication initiation protein
MSVASLAKGEDKKKAYVFKYQDLRDKMLGVDSESYSLWAEFKRNVLTPAVKEIFDTGWCVTAKEIKAGKRVDEIKFTFPDIEEEEKKHHKVLSGSKGDKPKFTPTTELQVKVITRLKKLAVTEAQIREILNELNDEEKFTKLMKKTYPLLRECETSAKPGKNWGAATMDFLKTEFPELYKTSR